MSAYKQMIDGEGYCVRSREKWRFACCDCGLVHDVVLAIGKGGWIGLAVKRNKPATKARRRSLKASK